MHSVKCETGHKGVLGGLKDITGVYSFTAHINNGSNCIQVEEVTHQPFFSWFVVIVPSIMLSWRFAYGQGRSMLSGIHFSVRGKCFLPQAPVIAPSSSQTNSFWQQISPLAQSASVPH